MVNTLKQLASDTNEVLLAQELRDSDVQKNNWQLFLAHIQEFFKVTKIPPAEQNCEYRSPDIILLRLTRR